MPHLADPPLSLYVHFPWCVSKCPYCDFNSHALKGELPQERYLAALDSDMAAQGVTLRGRPLVSVFMGGGTPSLFPAEAIERLLKSARSHFDTAESWEVTLEANPGTVERGRFAEYQAAGVNRVSVGAQSFDANALRRLGRIHSPDETRRAAEELHAAGLTNFNLDLMYALPEQTVQAAMADIEAALKLNPRHLSHYQLTLEPGTPFAAHPPQLPSDDAAAQMFGKCVERLKAAGFARYEVSAYAREGSRCRHNLNYWTFGDYVGVGAGAHGKLTDAAAGTIVRTAQPRDPRRYMATPAGSSKRAVARADLPFEFMLNALRLLEGFEVDGFETLTGMPWCDMEQVINPLVGRGLLSVTGSRCHATPRGLEFLNDLLVEFLPKKPASPQLYSLSMDF